MPNSTKQTNKQVTVKELNPKQDKFCREYCLDLNATQAAIRAGYSPKSATSIGFRLLQQAKVQARIDALQANAVELSGITHIRIIKELENIAFTNISMAQKAWFSYKEFEELPPEFKASIRTIDTKEKVKAGDVIERDIKIGLHDKLKALEILSNMLGFSKLKHEIEHSGTAPLNITVVNADTQKQLIQLTDDNN